jgi:hypothetical protein
MILLVGRGVSDSTGVTRHTFLNAGVLGRGGR